MGNCGLEMWGRAQKRGRRWELERNGFKRRLGDV